VLTFVGLGLFDKEDVSIKGLDLIRNSDEVFLECYTSHLMGTTREELEKYYGKPVHPLSREDVEQHPEEILNCASQGNAVFLCAGDPMVSTTHADLRIRAGRLGIQTEIIHAASIAGAVCGLSGLQNYRFGKACSVPFPQKNWSPTSPIDVIAQNLKCNLHTLVYLDIRDDRYMTVNEAVEILQTLAQKKELAIPLYVGIARAGSGTPIVRAGSASEISAQQFGPPLHIVIVPAELHDMEREYLEMFAGL
jgi:diphthine synthase